MIDAAEIAAAAAEAKDAEDVELLDVSAVTAMCDTFVLATGRTDRQVRAIVDEIEARVRADAGRSPLAVEGRDTNRWVLIDYGDVVVHVFQPDERRFYRLDRLYADAPARSWTSATSVSEG